MNKKDIHSAAQALGKLGGLAKSKAKAKAVRENGKLGGRPVGSKNTKPRKHRSLGNEKPHHIIRDRHIPCQQRGCLTLPRVFEPLQQPT